MPDPIPRNRSAGARGDTPEPPTPPPAQRQTPGGGNGWVFGGLPLVVLLVLIFANSGSDEPDSLADQPTTSATTADDYPDSTYDSDTSTTTDDEPTTTSEEPAEPTTTTFDPDTLNDASTDETPFTSGALMPQDFIDGKDVRYRLVASGTWNDCTKAVSSSAIQSALAGNGCSEMLVANFLSGNAAVIVTVWVYPFSDYGTASTAYSGLDVLDFLDLGCWDPNNGAGSQACAGNPDSATKWQFVQQNHRYVVVAQAMAVNHSNDESVKPWLKAASREASTAAGPQNYAGNQ